MNKSAIKVFFGILISILIVAITYLGVKNKINNVKEKILAQVDQMHFMYASTQKSNVPLEVVIVTAEKDFEVLPHCVRSVRKYVQQPITKITVVAPYSKRITDLTHSLKIEYLDENKLLDLEEFRDYISLNKWQLKHTIEWYYQQFLKLYFYKQAKSKYFFVIDSDIVLTRPMTLVTNDNIHSFYIGPNGGHEISEISIKRILGESQYVPGFSFIADLMCFDKDIVEKLIKSVELKFNQPFHYASIERELGTKGRFSEFELYGVYANFNSDNKIMASFLPKSEIMHHRKNIENDQHMLDSFLVPYIAYHSWLSK